MKFKQFNDGGCDIIFEKHEIDIINKKEKIYLDPVAFKHFGNVLVKIVMDWQSNFSDEFKNLKTSSSSEIKGKESSTKHK
jgi:hypothetical protein